MSDTTTQGIRVQVESHYEEDRSSPEEDYYFFSYHIRISNSGESTAQLLNREWRITDADGNEETVAGPGVVGEQPVLAPGAVFEYTSFCPLPTPVGTMEGHYEMIDPEGDSFEARIAPFTLAAPNALN